MDAWILFCAAIKLFLQDVDDHRIEVGISLQMSEKLFLGKQQYRPNLPGASILDWAGWPVSETFPVARPPVLNAELQNVLIAFIVYAISAQTTFAYESIVFPHHPFMQQKLFLL